MSLRGTLRSLTLAATCFGLTAAHALADDTKPLPSVFNPPTQLAALSSPQAAPQEHISLPQPLSEADLETYRLISELQEQGDWKAADKAIARLENPVLMGHVMAQRYLHPRKYRSKYKELKDWMDKYADLPQAGQIYKLALKRRPPNWLRPKPPESGYLYGSGHDGDFAPAKNYRPSKKLSRANRQRVAQLKRQMRWQQRKGWTKAVKNLLRSNEVKKLFHPVEYDRVQARLGAGYYADGRDQWAVDWAGRAAARSGKYLPQAHWTVGLASWRLGKFQQAQEHFAQIVHSDYAGAWLKSAGAFWAARVALVNENPSKVNHYLGLAAGYPRTFYGLLAKKMLGHQTGFDWTPPPLDEQDLKGLLAKPKVQRALALLQLEEPHQAERELRGLYGKVEQKELDALLGLSVRANMPGLAMRLGNMLAREGKGRYDSASYPLPDWQPDNGYQVDRALIYAIIRQESGFNPQAKSHAGARGLMQLMPRTASFIARDRRFRTHKRKKLFEPEVNLMMGQKYVNILLEENYINNDLFLMVAAWNGGPGNLRKWRKRIKHQDDPLLFIESIPSPETRIFIERVLTNLWIYRHQLGQPTPTLDAIAAGEWPVYTSLDLKPLMVAQSR